MNEFKIGDAVMKVKGYTFQGVVVSVFQKLDGQTRYVVECVVPGAEGMLHIYSAANLLKRDVPK